jgi:hypothetical protein
MGLDGQQQLRLPGDRTVLGFNLLGDGVRDALDPRLRY